MCWTCQSGSWRKRSRIAESEAEEIQTGTNFGDTEYTDYDSDYEDTYNNLDGAYIDENYDPDLDDWADADSGSDE